MTAAAKPTVIETLSLVMGEVLSLAKGDKNTTQSFRYARLPFWHKVRVGGLTECWPWRAGGSGSGYGVHARVYAHRHAYELIVGPIPDGLTIDHLCQHKLCCNPLHMEPVSRGENARRGEKNRTTRSGGRTFADRTHCKNGHEYTEGNFRWSGTTRVCRLCAQTRRRLFRERNGR